MNGLPRYLQSFATCFAVAGATFRLDPYLLAAICARESGGGAYLQPRGPGGKGDHGHGHGLMQIDDRTWGAWLARFDWADPLTNISKGAEILRDNYRQLGDVDAALAAYNAGPARAAKVLARFGPSPDAQMKIAALDYITTGGDYVSDVVRRRNSYVGMSVKN